MSTTSSQSGADFGGSSLIANRYQLKQKLGKGTFGEVFLADDLKFNPPRPVAIKILHSKFLNEVGVRADIEREASVLARFNHSNILRVIDFDISENQAYIVTDLAEGGSLANKIRPDPLRPPVRMPLEEVGWYLEQLSDALDEAHQAGLIHRDLKPLNILLNKRGRPLIADFGLATAVSSSQSSVLVDTQTSGTPPYMAPEQWMGHAGRASDIYALGIIIYQLITGQLPFQGDQSAIGFQHLNAPIPKLSDRAPDLVYPSALDDVLAGVLAKDPKQRTRSALEFYRRFHETLKSLPSGQTLPMNFSHGQSTGTLHLPNQPITTQTDSNPISGEFHINPTPSQSNSLNQYSELPQTEMALTRPVSGPLSGNNQVEATVPVTSPFLTNLKSPIRTVHKKNTGLFVWVAIVAVFVVIGVIFAGVLLSGNKPQNDTPTQFAVVAANQTTPIVEPTSTAKVDATTTKAIPTIPVKATPTLEIIPTPTVAPTTRIATTTSTATQADLIPAYTGATEVALPDTIKAQFANSVGSSVKNAKIQAFKVPISADMVKFFFTNNFSMNGWTDLSSQIPASSTDSLSGTGLSLVGPFAKSPYIAVIMVGSGDIFASAGIPGVTSSDTVYLVFQGNV